MFVVDAIYFLIKYVALVMGIGVGALLTVYLVFYAIVGEIEGDRITDKDLREMMLYAVSMFMVYLMADQLAYFTKSALTYLF